MMDALRTVGFVWLALIVSYGIIAVVLIIGRAGFGAVRQMLVARRKQKGIE
jgi:hypothetical protein